MKAILRNGFVLGMIVLSMGACNNEGPDQFTYYFAYVVNSDSRNISVYRINSSTGEWQELGGSPYSAGSRPLSIAVDPAGHFAYVTNADSNNVSAYAIEEEGDWDVPQGALIAISGSPFPAGRSPQSIAIDPSGRFAYVANAGDELHLGDISVYEINPLTGALTAITGSPFYVEGSPSSVAIDPMGKFVYVANVGSVNISAYSVNPSTGALTAITGSPFSAGGVTSSVTIDPMGKFVYAAITLWHRISANSINSSTGALMAVAGSPFPAGINPSSVAIDPSGKFVYTANAGNGFQLGDISVYEINSSTGALTSIAGSPFPAGSSPRFLAFDPTGKFAYAANADSNDVSAYTIDTATGALNPIAGSPIPAGTRPVSIAFVRIIQ